MSFNAEPKNKRLSIHNKYKRRLKWLSHALDDFIQSAERKLDESIAGKIHKRNEIEAIVSKCKELAGIIPTPEELDNGPQIRTDFLEMLQQASGDTDKILNDAQEFFNGFTAGDWDEMRRSFESNERKNK